jgi:hypothetical protein
METMRLPAGHCRALGVFLALIFAGAAVAQPPSGSAVSEAGAAPAKAAQGESTGAGRLQLPPLPALPADAPKPSPDPRNFEGTWYHGAALIFRNEQDMYGNPLPFSDRGRRLRDRRVKATYVDQSPYSNASAECDPPGQPWQMDLNFPFQVYQSKSAITFLFQEYHGIWNIRLNQAHRTSGARAYMGDSVAHWDGDTLVVDTIGYKRPLWIDVDGTPASANAHLVSRIRKINYGTPKLEIVTTIDDPEMYTAPWSIVRAFTWRPDMADFTEYNCEYQVGAPGGVSRYGLLPEPPEDNQ